MTRITSERHTDILNGYKSGGSRFNEWSREMLGDFTLLKWGWGALSMRWDIDDRFIMPDGVMFGGHIASVADHVAGLVAMTVLTDSKERFRTSRLETNYFRPLTAPVAMIEAKVTNASKTLIHVEADFVNGDEKLAVRINAVQVRRMTG
ncbi:PaaI family thioesterase [Hyphococcus flavus]|uniref:PaaI family thioesterase n=1 Tax=Hyphococcus flavus TaxID=1866326 RepID=A0AAE9ZD75_9PROT|nr:PaaI family thioesterase [Hyphococcus flavus]WDI30332.1 PaaI family thioesterase [Hyphococcus flavus]